MANTETTTYEIITLEPEGWTTDYIGTENTFATIDEALEAIRSLRALGGEWADTAYAVREAGTYQPIYGTESGAESTTCVHCDAELGDGAADVPAIDDDEAWAELAGDHAPDCEWVATRSGHYNAWHHFTIDIRRMSGDDWIAWCEAPDDDRIRGGGADPDRAFDTVYVEAPSRTQAREYLDSQLLPGMTISD